MYFFVPETCRILSRPFLLVLFCIYFIFVLGPIWYASGVPEQEQANKQAPLPLKMLKHPHRTSDQPSPNICLNVFLKQVEGVPSTQALKDAKAPAPNP